MIPPALYVECAPFVSPVTIEAIIQVESKGDPLALNVNRLTMQPPRPRDAAHAARTAETFIARGHSVDLGLMQVNSRNLPALGLTIDQVLEPCTNIRAGSTILAANYARAVRTWGEGQRALQAALSAYNTGDFARGFANGYVGQYYAGLVPAVAAAPERIPAGTGLPSPPPPNPYTAETQVYAKENSDVRIR